MALGAVLFAMAVAQGPAMDGHDLPQLDGQDGVWETRSRVFGVGGYWDTDAQLVMACEDGCQRVKFTLVGINNVYYRFEETCGHFYGRIRPGEEIEDCARYEKMSAIKVYYTFRTDTPATGSSTRPVASAFPGWTQPTGGRFGTYVPPGTVFRRNTPPVKGVSPASPCGNDPDLTFVPEPGEDRKTNPAGRCLCREGRTWDAAKPGCVYCPGEDPVKDFDRDAWKCGVAKKKPATKCPDGMVYVDDPKTPRCECEKGKRWNRPTMSCIPDSCTGGSVFDAVQNKCVCAAGYVWSQTFLNCVANRCQGGTVFNTVSNQCDCPGELPNWSASEKRCKPACAGGSVWVTDQCKCPEENPYWETAGQRCIHCIPGATWNGSGCWCPSGQSNVNGVCAAPIQQQQQTAPAGGGRMCVDEHNIALEWRVVCCCENRRLFEACIDRPHDGEIVGVNPSAPWNTRVVRECCQEAGGTVIDSNTVPVKDVMERIFDAPPGVCR